ncbi:hypothetical protein A2U01_0053978, partial [Trifolium medium]|nr:hypothetical protein [Trifolium medium]
SMDLRRNSGIRRDEDEGRIIPEAGNKDEKEEHFK